MKTISIKKSTWNRLNELKKEFNLRYYSDVIEMFLPKKTSYLKGESTKVKGEASYFKGESRTFGEENEDEKTDWSF